MDAERARFLTGDAPGLLRQTLITRAPNAISRGNAVAPAMRKPTPASKSAVFSSGSGEIACRRLMIDAASSGWPSVTAP